MIGAGNIVHPSTIVSVGKAEFSCFYHRIEPNFMCGR